jgi:hypothetical protein
MLLLVRNPDRQQLAHGRHSDETADRLLAEM